ncbi:MAG TPA: hypothetical protein VMX16_16610 [Terriglobia bacterium]|nr:hypothetical protein [Terriglobia bacterium]
MPEAAEEASLPPSGVHFVYDSGIKKIDQQEKLVDSLDVKMGVLVGFLGASIVGLLAAALTSEAGRMAHLLWRPTKVVFSIGIVLIVVCLYFAFAAFWTQDRSPGIRFQDLIKWTNEDAGVTKEMFLPTLLDAVDMNDGLLKRRQKWAKLAIISVFGALMVLWISIVLLGAQLLTGGMRL